MISPWLSLLALLLSGMARAQDPSCADPLEEAEFRALVARSSAAIFDDDVSGHVLAYQEFIAAVPCLDHQLPRDAWAELSLNEAIARYVTRADWQSALTRALQTFPDLKGVPDYLLKDWVRPVRPRPLELAIPSDATLFVDGRLEPAVPDFSGEHLVQVWRDGRWRSALLDHPGAIPGSWLLPKPVEVVEVTREDGRWRPHRRGGVGLGFGISTSNQLIEDSGTFLPDASAVGGVGLLGARGVEPLSDNAGLFYDGLLRIMTPTVRRVAGNPAFDSSPELLPRGYAGPALVFEKTHVGLGLGGFSLQTVEGNTVLTHFFPQPHLALGSRSGRASFEVGGGLTPSGAHGDVRGGWVLTQLAPIAWQFGFDATMDLAWFEETPPGDRQGSVLQLSVAGRIDLVWGSDR